MTPSSCDLQNEDTENDDLGDAFEANACGSEGTVSGTDGDGFTMARSSAWAPTVGTRTAIPRTGRSGDPRPI